MNRWEWRLDDNISAECANISDAFADLVNSFYDNAVVDAFDLFLFCGKSDAVYNAVIAERHEQQYRENLSALFRYQVYLQTNNYEDLPF